MVCMNQLGALPGDVHDKTAGPLLYLPRQVQDLEINIGFAHHVSILPTTPKMTLALPSVVGTLLAGLTSLVILANMSRLLGRAKSSFYYGKNSIKLRTKDGQETTLAALVSTILPPCRLNPFIFNGNLQTIWTVVNSKHIPVYYKRHVFKQLNPLYDGTFAVDFVVDPYDGNDQTLPPRTTYYTEAEFSKIASLDDRPMLVALHGLTGGSYELYLRHVLYPLTSKHNWAACVVNGRGCANSKLTSSILFNARATWDVRQVVQYLRETFPNRPLYAVGFSLGANIMTNYVAEEGPKCQLKAAVALSCPWNLEVSNLALQRSWFRREVFARTMGTNLKALYAKHKDSILQISNIDPEEVARVRYIHEFDRAIQCPTWGYPTEHAYYRDASSADSVLAVRIPFLGISAEDDPIVDDQAIPRLEFEQNPYAVLCTTSLGGHLSWFEFGGGRWMARATEKFFLAIHDDVDAELYSREHPLPEGEIQRWKKDPVKPYFDPMRRKMGVDVSAE